MITVCCLLAEWGEMFDWEISSSTGLGIIMTFLLSSSQAREGRWGNTRQVCTPSREWYEMKGSWDCTTGEDTTISSRLYSPWAHSLYYFAWVVCMTIQACWGLHVSSPIRVEECTLFTHVCSCEFVDDYCRLSAGLLRQATYSTTRLGVYQSLFDICSG